MPTKWQRNGNFCKINTNHYYINEVRYIDLSASRVIAEIIVQRDEYHKLIYNLVWSPRYLKHYGEAMLSVWGRDELIERYRQRYPKSVNEIMQTQEFPGPFEIDSKEDLLKLKEVLKHTNQDTKDLLEDLEYILLYKPGMRFSHIVPEANFEKTFVNPARKNSQKLVNLMRPIVDNEHHKEKRLSQLIWLLSQGEDPNQRNKEGTTALFYVIYDKDISVFELFLSYGACLFIPAGNPFDVNNGIYTYTLFELLIKAQSTEKLNIAICAYSKLASSVNSIEVESINVKGDSELIETQIDLATKKTYNVLFLTLTMFHSKVFAVDKYSLMKLFTEVFDDPKGEQSNVEKTFEIDFNAQEENRNEWIELVYERIYFSDSSYSDQLIGANLYRALQLDELKSTDASIDVSQLKDLSLFEWEYSIVDPKHRGFKLLSFLVDRVTHSNRNIREEDVAVYYSVLNYGGYQIIKSKTIHAPKYSSPFIPELLIHIIKKVYGDNVKIKWDGGIKWEIVESNPLVSKHLASSSKSVSFSEKIFNKFLKGNSEECSAMPILYFVSKESYQAAKENAAAMKINFAREVSIFSPYLKNLINGNKGKINRRISNITQHFIKATEQTFLKKLPGRELFFTGCKALKINDKKFKPKESTQIWCKL